MKLHERLAQLPETTLERTSGAPDASIEEIEANNQLRLPDDLRDTLRWSNGIEVRSRSPNTGFSMYDASDLAWTSSEPHFVEALPGMLILGTDNGGSVFYADVKNQIGRGPWAVFLVRMGDMGIAGSMFVGASFTEAIDTMVAGTNLFERPDLAEELARASTVP